MAANNLDAADLAAVARGGLIREDVMDAIWDISNVPLPFTSMIGTPDNVGNPSPTWVVDKLADPDLNNAFIDGQDLDMNDEDPAGPRVGNKCQISAKRVSVSTRANEVNTIGYASERARQIARKQIELRRDVEAISLSNQGSRDDDGNSVAGLSAGLAAWLTTNVEAGTGTPGGYNTGTGLVDAWTPGAARAATLAMVKDVVEQIYIEGGDPTVLMSVPTVIRALNEFMFDTSAQIATLQGETSADAESRLKAKGSVNIFIADHGQVLEFHPNRIQRSYAATGTAAHLFVLDPMYLRHGHLHGYRAEPQAKTGLSTKDQVYVDWTLKVLNELSQGMIADVDVTAGFTAGVTGLSAAQVLGVPEGNSIGTPADPSTLE